VRERGGEGERERKNKKEKGIKITREWE
jgi:hypothetical protein